MKEKFYSFLGFIKENPRYLALLAGLIVQGLEAAHIKVDSALVENLVDLLTLTALGIVMKKSETGKIV